MRRLFLASVLVSLAVLVACGNDDGASPARLAPCGTETPGVELADAPVIMFSVSSQTLRVEIADDSEEQHLGLMHRTCLGDDWGMIFVYGGDVQATFWMHNTFVPLTIAFIAADGTILELEDMQPQTDEQHQGLVPYRYAIEANQGWFAEHGIEVGDRATIPPNLSGS